MHIECPIQTTPLLTIPFHSISSWDECKKMQPSVKSNKTSTQNGHEWEEGQLWLRMRWFVMRNHHHQHGRNPRRTQTHHVDGPDRRLPTMFKCQLGLLTGHFVDGTLYSVPFWIYIYILYIHIYPYIHACSHINVNAAFEWFCCKTLLLLVVGVIG